MKTDIEIAQSIELKPIVDVVEKLGISYDDLELYGKYKAKLSFDKIRAVESNPVGKLILVTAINPTPAGEGKSTITIGLADALNKIGKKTMIAIREPSLGPVMGIKGGAAGGGYAQVLPMEDINLHFTGDMHAITTANNALSAMIDNHLHQGNELGIDQRRILWKRVVDLNDRALRHVTVGLGGPLNGIPREDGFDITVASEIMAILCLATDIEDLKRHVENIRKFGIPAVVAINEFVSDTEAEIAALKELCASINVPVELASVWADGAEGGVALAETLVNTISENPANYTRLYDNDLSVQEKIEKIVTEIYRGSKVNFEKKAQTQIAQIVQNGWDKLPICMAKTQYSFSDNPNALGAPENFEITIRELVPKLGAGFIVALTGDVMTMPGLPKRPAALNMDVESDGTVLGLF